MRLEVWRKNALPFGTESFRHFQPKILVNGKHPCSQVFVWKIHGQKYIVEIEIEVDFFTIYQKISVGNLSQKPAILVQTIFGNQTPGIGAKDAQHKNGPRISIRNVPTAKMGLPFHNFRSYRKFPLENGHEVVFSYIRLKFTKFFVTGEQPQICNKILSV